MSRIVVTVVMCSVRVPDVITLKSTGVKLTIH